MNPDSPPVKQHHLDDAAALCALVGASSVQAWLGYSTRSDSAEVRAALYARRATLQGMRNNPKYRDEADFTLRKFDALRYVVDHAQAHHEDMKRRIHGASSEPALVVRSVLADGPETWTVDAPLRLPELGPAPDVPAGAGGRRAERLGAALGSGGDRVGSAGPRSGRWGAVEVGAAVGALGVVVLTGALLTWLVGPVLLSQAGTPMDREGRLAGRGADGGQALGARGGSSGSSGASAGSPAGVAAGAFGSSSDPRESGLVVDAEAERSTSTSVAGGQAAGEAAAATRAASVLPSPGVVAVTLTTDPAGATVMHDDQPLGITPFTVHLGPDDAWLVQVASPGYQPHRVLLVPAVPEPAIRLAPLSSASGARATTAGREAQAAARTGGGSADDLRTATPAAVSGVDPAAAVRAASSSGGLASAGSGSGAAASTGRVAASQPGVATVRGQGSTMALGGGAASAAGAGATGASPKSGVAAPRAGVATARGLGAASVPGASAGLVSGEGATDASGSSDVSTPGSGSGGASRGRAGGSGRVGVSSSPGAAANSDPAAGATAGDGAAGGDRAGASSGSNTASAARSVGSPGRVAPSPEPGSASRLTLEGASGVVTLVAVSPQTVVLSAGGRSIWLDPAIQPGLTDPPPADAIVLTGDGSFEGAAALVGPDTELLLRAGDRDGLPSEASRRLVGPSETVALKSPSGESPSVTATGVGAGGYLLTADGRQVLVTDDVCAGDRAALSGIDVVVLGPQPAGVDAAATAACLRPLAPGHIVVTGHDAAQLGELERALGPDSRLGVRQLIPEASASGEPPAR